MSRSIHTCEYMLLSYTQKHLEQTHLYTLERAHTHTTRLYILVCAPTHRHKHLNLEANRLEDVNRETHYPKPYTPNPKLPHTSILGPTAWNMSIGTHDLKYWVVFDQRYQRARTQVRECVHVITLECLRVRIVPYIVRIVPYITISFNVV